MKSANLEIKNALKTLGVSKDFDIYIRVIPRDRAYNYVLYGEMNLIQSIPFNVDKGLFYHEYFHIIYDGELDKVWPHDSTWYVSEYAKTDPEEDMAEVFKFSMNNGICNSNSENEKIKKISKFKVANNLC